MSSIIRRLSSVHILLIVTLCSLLFSMSVYAGNTLSANQWLRVNQQLTSTNGDFKLVMQSDGNLVLYRISDSKALWNSKTNGKPGAEAVMQSDGNLVIYRFGVALWDSGTWTHPGSRLVMQDDGNAVIYNTSNNAVWATNTACTIQNVPVFGGKYEWGYWQAHPYQSCYAYVPLQYSSAVYYAYDWLSQDYCVIYPTFSGYVQVEICN